MKIGRLTRLAVGVVLIVTAGALARATPASADPGWTAFPGGHWCESTGYDSLDLQGVLCLDLDYHRVSSNSVFYRISVEMKCGRRTGVLVTCTSAQAKFTWIRPLVNTPEETARCVPSGPECDPKVTVNSHSVIYHHNLPGCFVFGAYANARLGKGGFTLPDGYQGFTYVARDNFSVCD